MIPILKLLMVKDKEFYLFLVKSLRIKPRNIKLYELAFLHRSASLLLPDGSVANNERLEYLGDAVIDAVIADYLFRKFPKEHEGALTRMRSRIVNRTQLDAVASKMGLGKVIIANGSKGMSKNKVCGDAFEALVGAIYLDRGYAKTRKYIIGHIMKNYIDFDRVIQTETDFKSRLIEWGQKYKLQIGFETVEEAEDTTGSRNGFSVRVTIGDESVAEGSGWSKKEAEQRASQKALEFISTSEEFSADILDQYMEIIREH